MNSDTRLVQVVLYFRQQLSRSTETEGYHVSVIDAPGRGWGGPFLPEGLDDAQIKAIRQLYRAYVERRQTHPSDPLEERSLESLRAAGNQLFCAFPETVQSRLHSAQSVAHEQGKSLEIVLTFDSNARPLLSLPWELLHDPEGRYFFALRGSVTRQLSLPTAPKRISTIHPNKVLGLWAEPKGIGELAVRRQYPPAPGHNDGVTWITGANSLERLETVLRGVRDRRFEGLHIVAHGRAGGNWSDFSLALADEGGGPHWISPDLLAVFVSGFPEIRFIYLDVCASTDSSGVGIGADYFPGGLASALLGAGVSAVLAMQDVISQEAAGLGAQTIYRELANGASLPRAATLARQAIRLQLDDPIHWSVPTLYCQRRPREERSAGLRIADWILDNTHRFFQPSLFIMLVALLLAGYSSRVISQVDIFRMRDWGLLGITVIHSLLLSILGAISMRAGQNPREEVYPMDGGTRLEVLLHKFTSATIWTWMWWCLIGLGWLVISWIGVADWLTAAGRQLIWGIAFVGIVAASYVGARQGIRQSRLFLRAGSGSPRARDWLILLAAPFFPLFLLWLMASYWAFLASGIGFYLVVGLLLVIAVITGRAGIGEGS